MTGQGVVHPYFEGKARAVLEPLGVTNWRPVASWAEQQPRPRDYSHGVIVAADGQIVAHTRRTDGFMAAWYVDPDDARRLGLVGNEVGMVLGRIKASVGQDVVHVKLADVAGGAAPRS